MRSLIRQPDDRRDKYTLLRLGCISYCTEEHDGQHGIECWEDTLQQVLDDIE